MPWYDRAEKFLRCVAWVIWVGIVVIGFVSWTSDCPFLIGQEYLADAKPRGEACYQQDHWWNSKFMTDVKITDVVLAVFTGLLVVVGWSQANRLRQTIETMDDTAERDMRAYLGMENIRLVAFSLIKPIRIQANWKNYGKTPARRFETSGSVWIAPLPLDDDADFVDGPEEDPIGRHGRMSIYSGDQQVPSTSEYTSVTDQIPMSKELRDEVIAGRFAIYLVGRSFYRDIFGKNRETSFCRYILPEDAATLINAELNNLPLDIEVRFAGAHIHNEFT